MRLLFDQNLSHRLVGELALEFPGSAHIRTLGLETATDREIWDYARVEDYLVVSKDSDFYQRSLFYGHPPKCIWLRIGNCTRNDLVVLLTTHQQDIHALDADPLESVLVLS